MKPKGHHLVTTNKAIGRTFKYKTEAVRMFLRTENQNNLLLYRILIRNKTIGDGWAKIGEYLQRLSYRAALTNRDRTGRTIHFLFHHFKDSIGIFLIL